MALEIYLLGPPRVQRASAAVSFDTRKATALLAHLALIERPRSREALCELLWPGHDPDRARGALRRTLSTLRTAVGSEWIETKGDSVGLRRGPRLELDVERFRTLAASSSAEELAAAAELCRGELLEGFGLRDSPEFDAWQLAQTDVLRRELGTALGRLIGLLAQRGEHARAVPYAQRWLEVEPLHEPAHRELIRLYAWSGDRAAALGQYRECVRTLTQELGVAPLQETAALFEQVSDGTLAPPSRASLTGAAPVQSGSARPELPLVGRTAELDSLLEAHRAIGADGRLAIVEGEAGIGKTRLAAALMAAVADEGAVMLAATCHVDETGLPYAPLVELLRGALSTAGAWADDVPPQRLADAALLLPELATLRSELPEPLTMSAPAAQARLLEGVANVLTAACGGELPGVLFLDDVHAADLATSELLAYLGRRLQARPLLLMMSWRGEAMPPGHRLRRLTTDLMRAGKATVERLVRLEERDVDEVVRAVRPHGEAAELARLVYLESEGLPLFVAEYVAALGEVGDVEGPALASGMRSLLEARLSSLSAMARQVLGAAAVIGGSFAFDTVRAASGRSDEETVGALEELVAQGVVRELATSEPAYDFSHQKLRELVYEDISRARRRLLHRRVAGALPSRRETAARVAAHLQAAGEHSRAAELYRLAAEHAASLLAHADAIEHLEAALALDPSATAGLHERIGDLRTLVGDYAGALASYESAAADSQDGALASLEHKLGSVHGRRGEWERSEARLGAALDAAPVNARGLRARIVVDLALTLHHAGRSDEAGSRAREAHELSAAAADRHAEAQAHNMLGMLARSRAELPLAHAELERSLALAEELGDSRAQVAALNNLALLERDAGGLQRALELTERALTLCAASGDRHREAALENNLADLHHAAGRAADAMAHLKRAVAIFAEVGADEEERLPEIWKLVSW
ncbi:MAG: AAA family ATPase [Actinomycetota bacterium]|nr:AAA family ATPase [Actinomycetota bacterium]